MTHSFPTRRSSDLVTRAGSRAIERVVVPVPDARHELDAEQVGQAEARKRLSLGVRVDPVGLQFGRILEQAVEEIVAFPHTGRRSEEHTSELQSLMRTSYAVFCLTKTNYKKR